MIGGCFEAQRLEGVSLFFQFELWLGLAWGHILHLAVFLLTHSSRPEPGADGCAFLCRVYGR